MAFLHISLNLFQVFPSVEEAQVCNPSHKNKCKHYLTSCFFESFERLLILKEDFNGRFFTNTESGKAVYYVEEKCNLEKSPKLHRFCNSMQGKKNKQTTKLCSPLCKARNQAE